MLKGCERWFIPVQARAHYCSPQCRQAATRWRRVKSSRRYRASAHGRPRRREENRGYRQRRRAREEATAAEQQEAREGKRLAVPDENLAERLCDRPGCYVLFPVRHEHSCRRFCSVKCRLALRRVLDREARYRQRRRRWRKARVTKPAGRLDSS